MTDIFKNKKALYFVALKYHQRILEPTMNALRERGATIEAFTVQAEAGFEITLNDMKMPYHHVCDFLDPYVSGTTNNAYRDIAERWQALTLIDQNLQQVPLVIMDKILRAAVESYYGIDKMLDTVKPDFVVSLHEINSWGKMLGYLCHKKHIPFFTFQEGLCYSVTSMYRWHTEYSDACVLWGEADRRVLIEANNDPARMPVVGVIDLPETIESSAVPERIEAARKAHEVPDGNKILIIFFAHAPYTHLLDTSLIHWMWNHPDVTVIFKFHPIQQKQLVESAMQTFGQIPSARIVIDGDTYGLLGAAHACVLIGASTTGIETLAFNKPLVEVMLPDSTYSYSARGAVPVAQTLGEAAALTWSIAEQGESSEWYARRQAYLKDHFFNYNDGKFDHDTIPRILKVWEDLLDKNETPHTVRKLQLVKGAKDDSESIQRHGVQRSDDV